MDCDCRCHLPGTRVYMPEDEACCEDAEFDRPPIPRSTPPPPEGSIVSELSGNATQGSGKAVIG